MSEVGVGKRLSCSKCGKEIEADEVYVLRFKIPPTTIFAKPEILEFYYCKECAGWLKSYGWPVKKHSGV